MKYPSRHSPTPTCSKSVRPPLVLEALAALADPADLVVPAVVPVAPGPVAALQAVAEAAVEAAAVEAAVVELPGAPQTR